jgi:hypothetical protein
MTILGHWEDWTLSAKVQTVHPSVEHGYAALRRYCNYQLGSTTLQTTIQCVPVKQPCEEDNIMGR